MAAKDHGDASITPIGNELPIRPTEVKETFRVSGHMQLVELGMTEPTSYRTCFFNRLLDLPRQFKIRKGNDA